MPHTDSIVALADLSRPAAFALLLWALPPAIQAAQSPTSQDTELLAASCLNCHAPASRAAQTPGSIPALGGQSAAVLKQRLQDFKTGKAADATVMPRLMRGYDDAQIAALAQWFGKDEK
ncbi:c-type cytochrome [Diaphorobacter aerolatus]|uniref:Cytochrome c domain-containing protein n=1 Tax=Diaphorobacter aerolatus TaxID=1288495 RepID=A0A7H0GMU5_9BURK|nr:hypothetical protein [Diaphorobacter aerolatus]QNP49611.1 hypothetical protein H9K75_06490 [Diaphorobacter aerolatus]